MTPSSTFAAADGDGYELQMGRWSRRLAGPFLDFVGTAGGDTVLDVGCGTGCLASELLKRCDLPSARPAPPEAIAADTAAATVCGGSAAQPRRRRQSPPMVAPGKNGSVRTRVPVSLK